MKSRKTFVEKNHDVFFESLGYNSHRNGSGKEAF